MPNPSSKDTLSSPPRADLDILFEDDMLHIDDTPSTLDESVTNPKQLHQLRKRAEDILEQKKLEQELNDYTHWDDWDDD